MSLRHDKHDWNPEAYARFRGLRLRPALDLLARIGELPEGSIVDLGCGDGAAAQALRDRFGRDLIGVDRSGTMLAKARGYRELIKIDIADWRATAPPALIFSNAALHWLPDHPRLLERFATMLAGGGTLAVQMPRQFNAPSHRFLRDIAAAMFPDQFDFSGYVAPVLRAEAYAAMLAPFGDVDAWETEYVQRLGPDAAAHPVRSFTAATAMRPILEKLSASEAETFAARYDAALAKAYPVQVDGGVLFPFRRIFFTVRV